MLKPLLTTALLFAAAPAFADRAPVAPSVRVVTADLDLSTAKGRATLDRRINVAVDALCGDAQAAPRTGAIVPVDRCHSVAASAARSQRDALLAAVKARR